MALCGISGGCEWSGGAEWRSQLTATPAKVIPAPSSRVGLAPGGSTKSAVEREKTAGMWERKKRAWHRGPETGRARQVGRKISWWDIRPEAKRNLTSAGLKEARPNLKPRNLAGECQESGAQRRRKKASARGVNVNASGAIKCNCKQYKELEQTALWKLAA